jgi:hypothetical protein
VPDELTPFALFPLGVPAETLEPDYRYEEALVTKR